MRNLLEIDSVILEFDTKRILQDVYLKCETGKVTGLLGRNGAGKSCLMKIIFGELNPNDKSVRINGKTLISSGRSAEDIRFLPQTRFAPMGLTAKRIFSDFRLDFADFLNYFPDFEKFYKAKLSSMSGGERRIIEIYSVLASRSKFCMLDEPFSHVYPVHVETLKRIILREKAGKGILITDHLYKHIIDICDDLYVISNGKTSLTESIEDLETLGYARLTERTVGR